MPETEYNAFISYKHDKSSTFARNLELAIKSYAKPIWQRPMAVFRDENHMVPGQPLDKLISDALERSSHLIYLASPEAAQSIWVQDELDQWTARPERCDRLIIVLTGGTIAYDPVSKEIDWERTDSLPGTLREVLVRVPLFVDCKDFASESTQTLENSEFRRAINQIVAKLRGVDPIEMSGEEVQQHRRNLYIRNAMFSAVAVSAVLAVIAAWIAVQNQWEAEEQTRQTQIRESMVLASASRNALRDGNNALAAEMAGRGLPKQIDSPDRPLVAEAVGALIQRWKATSFGNSARSRASPACAAGGIALGRHDGGRAS